MLERLRAWRAARRARRRVHRLLAELFRSPERLAGTSLQPRHAGRWILLGYETDGDEVTLIRFGIVRHPRPYAFSGQSHKVIEYYAYHAREERLERLRGVNVTRLEGRDDAP